MATTTSWAATCSSAASRAQNCLTKRMLHEHFNGVPINRMPAAAADKQPVMTSSRRARRV